MEKTTNAKWECIRNNFNNENFVLPCEHLVYKNKVLLRTELFCTTLWKNTKHMVLLKKLQIWKKPWRRNVCRFRNSSVWIRLQGGLKKTMPKRKATPHLVLLQQKEDSISSWKHVLLHIKMDSLQWYWQIKNL